MLKDFQVTKNDDSSFTVVSTVNGDKETVKPGPSLTWALLDAIHNKQMSEGLAEVPIEPIPCNGEIYKYGKVVAVFDCGKLAMEGLVKEASRHGIEMDWHYLGGRAVVKSRGDILLAKKHLEQAIPRLLPA